MCSLTGVFVARTFLLIKINGAHQTRMVHRSYCEQSIYSKTCLKRSLSKRTKIGFQDQLSLKQVKSVAICR